ncbi:hypothetical protein [Nostoc sp. UHCC 0302]|uniref:hypothetical protein n=1 Tax=Nostoc sp. UHCC 0302 TaxID=3134896 RepID=UPI00311C8B97
MIGTGVDILNRAIACWSDRTNYPKVLNLSHQYYNAQTIAEIYNCNNNCCSYYCCHRNQSSPKLYCWL